MVGLRAYTLTYVQILVGVNLQKQSRRKGKHNFLVIEYTLHDNRFGINLINNTSPKNKMINGSIDKNIRDPVILLSNALGILIPFFSYTNHEMTLHKITLREIIKLTFKVYKIFGL